MTKFIVFSFSKRRFSLKTGASGIGPITVGESA